MNDAVSMFCDGHGSRFFSPQNIAISAYFNVKQKFTPFKLTFFNVFRHAVPARPFLTFFKFFPRFESEKSFFFFFPFLCLAIQPKKCEGVRRESETHSTHTHTSPERLIHFQYESPLSSLTSSLFFRVQHTHTHTHTKQDMASAAPTPSTGGSKAVAMYQPERVKKADAVPPPSTLERVMRGKRESVCGCVVWCVFVCCVCSVCVCAPPSSFLASISSCERVWEGKQKCVHGKMINVVADFWRVC